MLNVRFVISLFYSILADLILIIHCGFVFFVVMGLVMTWIGWFCGWSWVRSWRFRIVHLLAMLFVLVQTWLGQHCPLTIWENQLRVRAGKVERYEGSCIEHWVHKVLYYEFSDLAFKIGYTTFFLLIVLSFVLVRPGRKG